MRPQDVDPAIRAANRAIEGAQRRFPWAVCWAFFCGIAAGKCFGSL